MLGGLNGLRLRGHQQSIIERFLSDYRMSPEYVVEKHWVKALDFAKFAQGRGKGKLHRIYMRVQSRAAGFNTRKGEKLSNIGLNLW